MFVSRHATRSYLKMVVQKNRTHTHKHTYTRIHTHAHTMCIFKHMSRNTYMSEAPKPPPQLKLLDQPPLSSPTPPKALPHPLLPSYPPLTWTSCLTTDQTMRLLYATARLPFCYCTHTHTHTTRDNKCTHTHTHVYAHCFVSNPK